MPNLEELSESFSMIRLSFSPTSVTAPSSLKAEQLALYVFLSISYFFLQTLCMTNSTNASLVPDEGGGANTSISTAGSDEFISLHLLYGLSIMSPFL